MGIGTTVVVLGTAHKETREVMETVLIMPTKRETMVGTGRGPDVLTAVMLGITKGIAQN